jgi:hypothetical protein
VIADKETRAYSFEPTWRIKRVSISQCNTPDPSHAAKPTKPVETPTQPRMPSSAFRERLVTLRSPELREIIMNASLKYFETHKEVVKILKRMQSKKPRPITKGGRVRRPTAGLYLYCRTQGELVDIIFELVGQDVTGCIEQDAKDLITILEEKGDGVSDLA